MNLIDYVTGRLALKADIADLKAKVSAEAANGLCRRRQMIDARDALAEGDGQAAWDALTRHERSATLPGEGAQAGRSQGLRSKEDVRPPA